MATLLGSRTTGLRCLAQLSPDGLVFTPRRANFVTSTGGPFQQLSIGSRTSDFFPARPSPSQRSKGSPIPTRRPYATTSSTPTTPSSPAPSASAAAELTWNRFFDLRRKRRYINTGASVICALAALGVGGPIIAQQDLDTWGAQISGIDPIFVFGGSSFAVAVAGWLCGPAFGGALFGAWAGRRGWAGIIAEKEKSFFSRIKRYRADPSSSSPQNPIPDYYGEKIGSVADYRRWLKDQRTYSRKMYRGIRTTYGSGGAEGTSGAVG